MSSSRNSRESIVESLRIDCDNYDQSVLALKAIANVIRWDETSKRFRIDSVAAIGKRLQTSPHNRVSPSTTVTPDMLVTRKQQGFVVEAKTAMSRLPERREARLLDLQKYDDELFGWPTTSQRVDAHEIILIVHYTRAFDVNEHLDALRNASKFRIDRPFAVVSFVINDQRRLYLALELKSGALSDTALTSRLRRVVSVAVENLAADPQLALLQLYDAVPPLPYLMNLVHEAIVGSMLPEHYDELRDSGEVRRPVTLSVLRRIMAERFGCLQSGDGIPEIPQHGWLIESMNAFVAMGWAKSAKDATDGTDVGGGDYTYIVKRRQLPMEQFLGHCADVLLDQQARKEREEQKLATAPLLSPDWTPVPTAPASELLEPIHSSTVDGSAQ